MEKMEKMENYTLVEINRMKEIMGLRLLTESKLPFVDDFIKKLAKNADEGDTASKKLFKDIFEEDSETIIKNLVDDKDIDIIIKSKSLLNDFVDEALRRDIKVNGMTVKNIFYDTLENSLDSVESQLGKDLKDIEEKINNLSKYESDPDLYNDAIDALVDMKKQINDVFSTNPEIQKIINSSSGLDNLPAKKVIDDVADNVVDDAVTDVIKKSNWNKSWDEIEPETQ